MNPRERQVVARLSSGLVIRGTVLDFNPERPAFRVTPDEGGRGVEIKLKDLKALFFPKVGEDRRPPDRPPRYGSTDPYRDGKRIAVHFNDDEWMTGFTLSYRPQKIGFFLFPDDPETQHEKVFIYSGVTQEVLTGPEAETHPMAVRTRNKAA